MLNYLRGLTRRWGKRLAQIARKFDAETFEAITLLPLAWQGWRLGTIAGLVHSPFAMFPNATRGRAETLAGTHINAAAADFWAASLGASLPCLAWMMGIVVVLGVFGLLEERTHLRLFCAACGLVWWSWAGTMLMIHTPGHDGGVWYGIFDLFSFGAITLLCQTWDREHEFRFVGRVAAYKIQQDERRRALRRQAVRENPL